MFKKIIKLLFLFTLINTSYAAREGTGYNIGTKQAGKSEIVRLIDAKHYKKAINLILVEIKKNKQDPDLYNYLGYVLRQEGNFNLAIKNYIKALELDPNHLGAHNYIGIAYLKKGLLEKSILHLEKLKTICSEKCNEYIKLKNEINHFLKNAKK